MADKNEMSQEEYNSIVFEEGGSLVVDLSNVEEQKFELIPKGIYNAEVDNLEYTMSKSSGAPMFSVVFKITDGDFANRKLYSYMSFSPKALSGTKTQLLRLNAELFKGAFKPQEVADSGMLLGAKCRIKVGHEDYQGEPRARVQTVLSPVVVGAGGDGGFFGG